MQNLENKKVLNELIQEMYDVVKTNFDNKYSIITSNNQKINYNIMIYDLVYKYSEHDFNVILEYAKNMINVYGYDIETYWYEYSYKLMIFDEHINHIRKKITNLNDFLLHNELHPINDIKYIHSIFLKHFFELIKCIRITRLNFIDE